MPNTYGAAVYGVATYGATQVSPVITNVVASAITSGSATITWTTDVPADSLVEYGLTTAYGSTSALYPTLAGSHSVTLGALQSNTLYHFRVRSTTAAGSTNVSTDQTLQTAVPPPVTLSNFQVASIGPVQVSVTWSTSVPTDSQVDYGLAADYGLQTPLDSTQVSQHQVTIAGLFPNTTYHLRARSNNPNGGTLLSGDLQVQTPRPSGRVFTWIEPNGTAHVLDPSGDADLRVFQGAKGYGTPPTQWLEDRVPQHDGPIVRDVLYDAREIEVPLMVVKPDYPSLLAKVRTMRQWMNVKNGDGSLQIADPDGTVRQFVCRLKQGLEGQEGPDQSGPTFRRFLLVFRTTGPDPYARWPAPIVLTFTQAAATATWFPWVPITLGGVGIFAQPTVVNPGDVEAEPVWTLAGPMTNPVLTNTTTGAKLSLTTALLTGQTLTIDTRFRVKSVIRNDGTKLFSALSNDSALWTLAPGTNTISVVTTGTTAASQITLQFVPRTL